MRRRIWITGCIAALGVLSWWLITCSNQPPLEGLFRTSYVSFEGQSFLLAERGERRFPPVIYVHGSPGSWSNGANIALDAALDGQVWFAAFDRPGFGGSKQFGFRPSLCEQADYVRAVLQLSESQSGAILVGHSYGAPIAVKFAAEFPALVDGLVLIGAAIDPELEEIKWFQRLADTAIGRTLLPKMWENSNDELLPLRSELEELDQMWHRITAKVVMIHGNKDRLVPYGNVAYATEKVSADRLSIVTFPQRGHFIPWQDQDAVAQVILDLLNRR